MKQNFIKLYLLGLLLGTLNLQISSELHSGTKGIFWHLTDIHVDKDYSRTGNPNDLCHVDGKMHKDNGLFGNFLCDSPQYLVDVTIQAMKNITDEPDFIVWTGDNLPHTRNPDPGWSIVFAAISNITEQLITTFPRTPIFPCIGNHDTFPPNILLPNSTTHSIYEGYLRNGSWGKILPKKTWPTFVKGGYYSTLIKKIRIISLNTILWYSPNKFTISMTDPADQFKWLKQELQSSTERHEQVYIIGHVPPGFYNTAEIGRKNEPTYHPQFLKQYLSLLSYYSPIIKGQLFGHLHIDMFQLFQCDIGTFIGTTIGTFKASSLLASSVTPWHSKNKTLAVNPSVRLMYYNISTATLKDYKQYFLNLSQANEQSQTNLEETGTFYELLYTFTETYKVKDLTTESLVSLYNKMKSDQELFDLFYKYTTAGKENWACDSYCKKAQLCSIACTSETEYNDCMKMTTSVDPSVHPPHSYYVIYSVAGLVFILSTVIIIIWHRNRSKSGCNPFSTDRVVSTYLRQ